jgi:hypothetical protein
MNSSFRSYGFAGASPAGFRWERPGSPGFCRSRPWWGSVPAQIGFQPYARDADFLFQAPRAVVSPLAASFLHPLGPFSVNQTRMLSPVVFIARH